MFTRVMALAMVLMATSCMEINGTLSVKREVTFNQSDVLAVGDYVSQLKINSRDRVTLEVRNGKSNQRDLDVDFDIPKGSSIPQDNGNFFFRADEVGQPYDLSGEVQTDITRSARRFEREQCTYTDYETRCRRVCQNICRTRPDGRRVCRQRCENRCSRVAVTRWGLRDIEFYIRTENKDYFVELLLPNSNRQAAHFDGNYRRSQRIIEYRGQCNRR